MKGVIFDFNGTMFFDEPMQNRAWRQFVREKAGREILDEEFHTIIHGRNATVIFEHFLQKPLTREEVDELEEGKEVIYRRLCLESGRFHLAQGLPALLDALKEAGVPRTIATGSSMPNVRFYFQHLPLERWFRLEDVVCNDGVIRAKPEPDIFLKAAQVIGVDISRCAVLEDAASGITAARRAGAGLVIGVASMLPGETLKELGAGLVIDGYEGWERLMETILPGWTGTAASKIK